LEEFKINTIEEKYLLNVFQFLSLANHHKYFTKDEICEVLKKMEIKMAKSDIELMIW
jgi:hypothetical protein